MGKRNYHMVRLDTDTYCRLKKLQQALMNQDWNTKIQERIQLDRFGISLNSVVAVLLDREDDHRRRSKESDKRRRSKPTSPVEPLLDQ